MATEAFFPVDSSGHRTTAFNSFKDAWPIVSFISSLLSSAWGMSRFIMFGPFPTMQVRNTISSMTDKIINTICLILVNLMYSLRLFAIEAIFFSYYQSYDDKSRPIESMSIPPLISNDLFRLPLYAFPALISILVNGIRLAKTFKGNCNLFVHYPQIFFLPRFTPFMYEGVQYVRENGEQSRRIGIWKRGTIIYAFYLFCFAGIGLAISEYARGTVKWDFTESELVKYKYTNAVFKIPLGNITFCIVTLFFSSIMIAFMYARFFENSDSKKVDVSLGNVLGSFLHLKLITLFYI